MTRTTITRTESDDGTTVELHIEGDGAYDRAKEVVREELDDVAPERVTEVSATIHAAARSNASDNGENRGQIRPHIIEDERELGDANPGTGDHEVLTIIDEHATRDDPMPSTEITEHVEYQNPAGVSPSLSGLYRRKLVERDPIPKGGGGKAYAYWLSPHGEAWMSEHGAFSIDRVVEENPR